MTNTQQGYFSAPAGIINQAFFDAAFAGRVHADPILKEAYNCSIVGMCTMSTWLDEYMGFETSCDPAYSLVESNSQMQQIKVAADVTIPVNPGTASITLDANSQFVSDVYILPQIGNTIVLSPSGELAEVTAITGAAGSKAITVRLRNEDAAAQDVSEGDELLVLSGAFIDDCDCPTGQFSFDDLPTIHDLEMITFGDRGELCGDALLACQYLKLPFTDDCGNVIEKWYVKALQDMYKRFEMRKHYERLLNPIFGIIPTLKSRGQNFTPASSTEITVDDIRSWKQQLDAAGIGCRDYAVFAGGNKYSQWMQLLGDTAVQQLSNEQLPYNMPKWINMEYTGIKVEGMTLIIYDDCSFSNGKALGGQGMNFPNSAIFIPLCDRTTNCRSGDDSKLFTTVYFKDNTGRVWDNLTDSNGVLGTRNTFGAGCEQQEWTIKTRFTQEIHCPQSWGYDNLL